LVAATLLARKQFRVVVLEKRLAPGGGVWGGGMLFSTVVVQPEAEHLLAEFGVRYEATRGGLLVAQAVELASALILTAVQAGVTILNAVSVEDVMVTEARPRRRRPPARRGRTSETSEGAPAGGGPGEGSQEGAACGSPVRVTGLVANFTPVEVTSMHVDPLSFRSRAVLDASGHDAVIACLLEKHNFPLRTPSGKMEGEGPMWAQKGEEAVVTYTREIFPGTYVSGMAACAVFGGPRMGPIFGGMLLSGEKVAGLIGGDLSN
jgi:thiamine thiazole synthase